MAKYIDKSALVAEIERRKQTWQHQDQQYVNGGKDVCDYLLGFLDTLEVKEVGFEKERLTWEDIETIGELRLNVALELRRKELKSPISNPLKFTKEDMCQEVLKRFKAQKGE